MVSRLPFFIVRRLINAAITIVALILLIFLLLHILVPTPEGMARIIAGNPRVSPSNIALIIKENGLNLPLWQQFFNYLAGIFQGNWGTDTIYKIPEIHVLEEFLPITLELIIIAQVVGVLVGLYTGGIAASNRNRPQDYAVKAVYLTTWSAPIFLVGFIVQLVFAYWLNLLPSVGYVDPTLIPPHAVTGFPLIDSLVAGDWTYLYSTLQHLVLPATAIAVAGFGLVTRLTRASMIDALDKDYVKLAYMKGLSKRKVVWGTAFRNAVIPIITLIALLFAFSAGGAVVIEDIFAYHGMGYFVTQAIYNTDYTAILAYTVIIGISVVGANLIADLLYAVADPRVRLS